jgi:hypothetical protein
MFVAATMEAQVHTWVSPGGICGGKSGTGAGFSQEFFSFLSVLFHHGSSYSYTIWGMNNRPVSGSSLERQSPPSTRTYLIKYARATSRVNWLSGEETNVSKTISVLVFRVLMYLENHSMSVLTQQALGTTQQLPLASAPLWTWNTGRPISDRLILKIHQYPHDEDRDCPWNVGFFTA